MRLLRTVGKTLSRLMVLMACWIPVISQASSAPLAWPAHVREHTFALAANAGNFHYFTLVPANGQVTRALIVLHGHPRDVGNTLSAAAQAASTISDAQNIAIVAPLFQVSTADARHCHSDGLPEALPNDALWNCHSWLEGGKDQAGNTSAFRALDETIGNLKQRWPALSDITVAGFSAGGQFVQHYIAFSHPPAGVTLRYVVADPGSWLYFDSLTANACPAVSDYKYGMHNLPAWLQEDPDMARERYRSANIRYLEGGDDQGKGKGRYWRILDKSCAAMAQGRSRRERGENYARYDRDILKPARPHTLAIVTGCAHDVRCVFPSVEGRQALFKP